MASSRPQGAPASKHGPDARALRELSLLRVIAQGLVGATSAASTGPGGASDGAKGTDGYRAALAEIARRYATSHGPVSAADLARWTTLPLGEARQALADALETTGAQGFDVDAAQGTLFLASFDELHVGYKGLTSLVDQAGEALIWPGRNGVFRPLLVDRGRVVAVRPAGEGLIWAGAARRSKRLERDVEQAVTTMEQHLSA